VLDHVADVVSDVVSAADASGMRRLIDAISFDAGAPLHVVSAPNAVASSTWMVGGTDNTIGSPVFVVVQNVLRLTSVDAVVERAQSSADDADVAWLHSIADILLVDGEGDDRRRIGMLLRAIYLDVNPVRYAWWRANRRAGVDVTFAEYLDELDHASSSAWVERMAYLDGLLTLDSDPRRDATVRQLQRVTAAATK